MRRIVKMLWRTTASDLLRRHFAPLTFAHLTVSERKFPLRVRADLQRAIDRLFGDGVLHFCGVQKEFAFEGVTFPDILTERFQPVLPVPPQYEEVDVGDDEPVRCLKNGLWLLERDGTRYAVLFSQAGVHGQITRMAFQIAVPAGEAGVALTQSLFKHLEDAVLKAQSYRGKILSL